MEQQKQRRIFGLHAVLARLLRDGQSVRELHVDKNRLARPDKRLAELLKAALAAGVAALPAEGHALDALLPGMRHQGVVAFIDVQAKPIHLDDVLDTLDAPPFLLVLDGVTDPRNLGACLRVADGAGVHAVVAPKDKSAPLSDVARKTACGAAESVPYVQVTNLARSLREMKERGIAVLGLAGEAEASLYEAKWPAAVAFVLGAEGEGLRRLTRETCDAVVGLPMLGMASSLNVSVAAGICLYEAVRRGMAAKTQ
jgi:23S rRNA (guanosine2251-2'-O)-methyltransferase